MNKKRGIKSSKINLGLIIYASIFALIYTLYEAISHKLIKFKGVK